MTESLKRCMDAGVIPPGDARAIALTSGSPWSVDEQLDRFLGNLAGLRTSGLLTPRAVIE